MKWTKKLFAMALSIAMTALVITSFLPVAVNALAIPPVISISSNLNADHTAATITAVAVDLSGSGIAWTKIYEDGNLVKTCNTGTCVSVVVHIDGSTHSYYAKTADNGGRTATSGTISVTFDSMNNAPVLDAIGDKTVNENETLQFTIHATDSDGNPITYSATGLPAGATLDANSGDFSWTTDFDDAGIYDVTFTASDGSLSDSETITITVVNVNRAPVLDEIGNKTTVENMLLEFIVTGSDPDGDATALSAANLPAGASFDGATGNFSWTPDYTQAGTYEVNFTISDGDLSDSELVTITVLNIDIDAPKYSDLTENPADPAIYVKDAVYEFNATWTDDVAVGSVWINFNGADYSATQSGDVYSFTISDLAAGTYNYEWFANDTSGNMNQTGVLTYTVDKANPVLKANLTSPVNYETASDYAGWEENLGDEDLAYELYLDGVLIDSGSSVSDNSVLGVGTHTYNYTTLGGENYTDGNDAIYLIVNQATPNLSISLMPNSTISQGIETTATGTCPSQLTCTLEMDGSVVSNPDVQTLGAGTYNYTYSTAGNENYTANSVTEFLVVTKILPDLHLYIDGLEEDKNVTYTTATNASAFSSTSDVELYRNGALVSDEDASTLGAGIYNYTAVALENENYTSASVTRIVIIGQATPVLSLNIAPGTTVNYLTATNVTASGNAAQLTYVLTRDGVNADAENGVEMVLGAGIYNYTYSTAGNENYTAAAVSEILTVNGIAPDLHLFVNGAEGDDSILYGSESNITVYSTTSSIELYRNGLLIANPDISTLGVGVYNYTAYALPNTNYSGMSVERTLTVSSAAGIVSLTFDKASPQDFGTTINATCSIVAGDGAVQLFRNGADVTSENGADVLLGAGSWDYSCYMAATANYTEDDDNATFVINPIAPDLHLYLNGAEANDSIVYGTESNASAMSSTSDVELYRNGALVSDEDIATLGAGTYNYTADALANQNYTSLSTELTLTVTQAMPVLSLNIAPATTVVYGTAVNVTASGNAAQLAYALTRDWTNVDSENGVEVVLTAGVYNYTYSTDGNENYTDALIQQDLTVTQGTPTMTYFLNGAAANLTLTYGESVNASAFSNAGTVNIFRDGTDVSGENGLDVVLGAGTYLYEFNVTGNENYSDIPSEFLTLVVNKAAAQASLVFDKTSPQTYGTSINATCSIVQGDGILTLYRNGADITGENGLDVILGAGTWNYNCSVAEGANYTAAENASSFVMDKATPVLSTSVTSPITYGTASDYSGSESNSGDDDLVYELYLDGALIDSGSAVSDASTLGAGNHTYNYTTLGGENYTSAERIDVLEVGKIAPNLQLFLNGAEANDSIVYGTESNASAVSSTSDAELYRNGALVSDEDIATLGAGVYNYTAVAVENENYTSLSTELSLTVTQATSSCSISSNSPQTYPNPINVSASCDNPEASLQLFRNGSDVSGENSLEVVLGAGTYDYLVNVSATENYTSASASTSVVVSKATTALNLAITPSNNEYYGIATTATATGCPAQLTCALTRNGANADAENGVAITLGAGTYNYTYLTAGNENYTADSVSDLLTVNKVVPTMTYSVNGGTANLTLEDPAAVNATVSSNFGTARMFRNGADADAENGIEQTLNLGTYLYAFNVTGNENYTDVASEFVTVEVVDTTAPLIEFVMPTRLSGRYVINTFEMNVSATDVNLANITIYAWNETGDLYDSFTCASSPCDNVFVLPEGNFTFNASATDTSGNTNWTDPADSREYDIDTIKPQVQFVLPTPDNDTFVVADGTINVTASDVHLDSINVRIYNESLDEVASCSDTASPVECLIDVSALGDGIFYFNATASDTWGWSNRTETRVIVIDANAPLIWFEDESTQSGDQTDNWIFMNVSASDKYLADITVYVYNESGLMYSESFEAYNVEFNYTDLEDGTYYFNATATDAAGHENSTETRTVVIDSTAPAIEFVIPTPANGTLTDNDSMELNVSVSDANLDDVVMSIYYENGTLYDDAHSDNSVFPNMPDGVFHFNASANDTFGNSASTETRTITIDASAPIISFVAPTPADLDYINDNNFSVNATATDSHLANLTVYLYNNATGLVNSTTVASGENFVTFDNLPDGVYEINATAVDLLGHENSTETRTITVDGNAPKVQFVTPPTPANGSVINTNLVINVSALDYHISHIDIILYDENLNGLVSYTRDDSMGDIDGAQWTQSLSDGIYYYNASATDSAGNMNATELRMITVDKTGPNVTNVDIVPDSVYNTESVNISADVWDLHGVSSVIAEMTLPNSSVINLTLSGSESYSGIYTTEDVPGTYVVRIIAADSLGNVNDTETHNFTVTHADKSIFNSWIDSIYYAANFEWDVTTRTVSNSSINDTTVNGTVIANITSSILANSVLTDVTVINYCQVYDSTIIGGTCDHAYIDPSTIINSNTTGSTIKDSNITDSNATYSYVENSSITSSDVNGSVITLGTVDSSSVLNSTVTGANLTNSDVSGDSTITDSNLTDSAVSNSSVITGTELENVSVSNSVLTDVNITLKDLVMENATIINGTAYNGTFTYNGTTKTIDSDKALYYLVNFGPNASLGVSPSGVYTGDSVTFDASATVDPNLNESGDNIALTFTENLTYTYYIWSNTDGTGYTPFNSSNVYVWTPSTPGNFTIYVEVTDVFGEKSESTRFDVSVSTRPRSGGGGGGGSCTTNWTCTEWTNCSSGLMTRTCTKTNPRCSVKEAMPATNMTCITLPENETDAEGNATSEGNATGTGFTKISGEVIGAMKLHPRVAGLVIFAAAMLIAGGILWLARKKKISVRKFRRR